MPLIALMALASTVLYQDLFLRARLVTVYDTFGLM